MRSTISFLLLVCVGIQLLASAATVRICMLDLSVSHCASEDSCCHDCHKKEKDKAPCCHVLEALPDTSTPPSPFEFHPVSLTEVTSEQPQFVISEEIFVVSMGCTPVIRGPTSPAAYRARLEIWRI